MSPEEPIALPAPNRYPDTPESLQECLELKDHIDTLLAMWKYSAHHPSATPLRVAELIQDDCGPVEEIAEDYEANTGFGGKYTHDQADYLVDRDAARRALVGNKHQPVVCTAETVHHDNFLTRHVRIIA